MMDFSQYRSQLEGIRKALGEAGEALHIDHLREQISELDLGALTEFKRSSNGTVEVKLADRAAVLGRLLEQLKEEENAAPAAFLQALDQPDGGGPPAPVCSRR